MVLLYRTSLEPVEDEGLFCFFCEGSVTKLEFGLPRSSDRILPRQKMCGHEPSRERKRSEFVRLVPYAQPGTAFCKLMPNFV